MKPIYTVLTALLFFSISINWGYHFTLENSYVHGRLVDYLQPTIFLSDFLIMAFLLLELFRFKKTTKKVSKKINPFYLLLLALVLVSFPSFFLAKLDIALYRWLFLTKFVVLAFFVSRRINFSKYLPLITKVFALSVIFQAVVATLQFMHQASLFGYLFLGESDFRVSSILSAKTTVFGELVVRSYGTFPHPNVLGGFLSIALVFLLYHFLKTKDKFMGLALVLGYPALVLTFSKTAMLCSLLGTLLILIHFSSFKRKQLLSFLSVFALLLLSVSLVYTFKDDLSVSQRMVLNKISLSMLKENLLSGVGIGQFIVNMDKYAIIQTPYRLLQPVHSVYLLVLSELGLSGLVVYLSLIMVWVRQAKQVSYLLLVSTLQLLFIGFFDHYLFTLNQGLLLFFLILGLSFSERAYE